MVFRVLKDLGLISFGFLVGLGLRGLVLRVRSLLLSVAKAQILSP